MYIIHVHVWYTCTYSRRHIQRYMNPCTTCTCTTNVHVYCCYWNEEIWHLPSWEKGKRRCPERERETDRQTERERERRFEKGIEEERDQVSHTQNFQFSMRMLYTNIYQYMSGLSITLICHLKVFGKKINNKERWHKIKTFYALYARQYNTI